MRHEGGLILVNSRVNSGQFLVNSHQKHGQSSVKHGQNSVKTEAKPSQTAVLNLILGINQPGTLNTGCVLGPLGSPTDLQKRVLRQCPTFGYALVGRVGVRGGVWPGG